MYEAALREKRRRFHRELASISTDIEEQARHLSLSSDGPDADLADLMDRAAEHALFRGAPQTASDPAEQAARRTPTDLSELMWDRLVRAGYWSLNPGTQCEPERSARWFHAD